jgi:tetratricopeptide (TPR) repeat protein
MRRRCPFDIVLTLLLSLLPAIQLQAQEAKGSVESLIRQADSILALRNPAAARDIYNAALSINSASVPALIGVGKAAMAERSWSGAIDAFERASELDVSSLDARYHLGCAYAERGRSRYLIERLMGLVIQSSFDKARSHFHWVLSRDSLFRDALYQLALVFYFQREYRDAIPLALKQIEMKPDLRNGHSGVLKIYREAIASWSASDVAERTHQPENDYDRFFHAEYLRRNGRLEEADSCLREMREKPGIVRPQLILQSLARIKAKERLPDEVEQLVTESIVLIRTMADADLVFEDVKYLFSDKELVRYDALVSASEARQFFNAFWTKRNPYPAQRANARIVQHYERLAYAEEFFAQFGRKTFAAETMPIDFPQAYFLNEEFNDKGIIYLRHGEPNRKINTLSSGSFSGPTESNESWLYFATPEYGEMLFDFYIPLGAHLTEWRLIPVLPDRAMWEERAEYSHKYSRLAFGTSSGITQNMLESTEQGKREIESGISTDRFSFADTLRYYQSPISIICFRGSKGRTRMDIGYVVVPSEIAKGFPDTVRSFEVETQYSLYTPAWKRAALSRKSQAYGRTGSMGDVTIEMFSASVMPDSYFVAWQAKSLRAKMVFNGERHVLAPDFSGSSLNISDIELAYTIVPAKPGDGFAKGSLSVVPNPLGKCPLDHPLYLYFEVYNLAKDANGNTSYTIEYKLASVEIKRPLLASIFGSRKKTSIAVPSERSGKENWSPEHMALDVSELEPGKYNVQVTLKDRVAGTSVSRSIAVEIYEKQ